MRTPEQVLEQGERMLIEVIEAMCCEPDMFTVQYHDDGNTVRVEIVCHPHDSRTIVGKGAAHLKQLASLARSLFWGTHRIVQIMPVQALANTGNVHNLPYTPLDDWDEQYLLGLFQRIGQAVFRQADVAVVSTADTTWSNTFRMTLTPPQPSVPVNRLAQALSVLFLPIGTTHGRMIFATVQNARG